MLKLPGLIDPHVHFREPGQIHKEDWDTGTAAALAGGFTMVLAMPNTKPPIFDEATLELALKAAKQKARCDYAQYVGAGPDNADIVPALAHKAAGLKMYLISTFGELRLNDISLWMPHFEKYPKQYPIVVHSESRIQLARKSFARDRCAVRTHVQKERFEDSAEYEKVKGAYVIDPAGMKAAKRDMIVMHPCRASARSALTSMTIRAPLTSARWNMVCM
jgi:dihydroorotase-like cyclic amidohydrolase